MTTNGTVRYFISDHLGSTNALTDANGAIVEQTNYDSFGNATSNLSTRYQFTGREFDNLTGLHYYRARWYDASVGRFISEDPIGFAGGDVNLYGYVGNKPLNQRDPSGLVPFKLPSNPSQLPPGWLPDNVHKNPNGSRWTSPSGDTKLEFEPGRPGQDGFRGKDHWHKWVPSKKDPDKWIREKDHLNPGDEIDIEFSACPIPAGIPLSQPTMEELRLQIEYHHNMEKFWGKVLVGSAAGGAAYLAGPMLIPAAAAGGSAIGRTLLRPQPSFGY